MKQIVEEAANKYTDGKCEERGVPKKYRLHFDFDRQDIECAFLAGAEWQAKQSPWISVKERLPEKDGYYLVTDGENVGTVYFFKEWNKFAVYEKYPHPFYKDGVIKLYMPIPSFDQILKANKDVLQRLKEKGD